MTIDLISWNRCAHVARGWGRLMSEVLPCRVCMPCNYSRGSRLRAGRERAGNTGHQAPNDPTLIHTMPASRATIIEDIPTDAPPLVYDTRTKERRPRNHLPDYGLITAIIFTNVVLITQQTSHDH